MTPKHSYCTYKCASAADGRPVHGSFHPKLAGIGSSHWTWMRLTMQYNENRCLLSLWKGGTVQAKCICMRTRAQKSGSNTLSLYRRRNVNVWASCIWVQRWLMHHEIKLKTSVYTDRINDRIWIMLWKIQMSVASNKAKMKAALLLSSHSSIMTEK